jgi:hypothetical protein
MHVSMHQRAPASEQRERGWGEGGRGGASARARARLRDVKTEQRTQGKQGGERGEHLVELGRGHVHADLDLASVARVRDRLPTQHTHARTF